MYAENLTELAAMTEKIEAKLRIDGGNGVP
jgi:hypothetical protein